MNGQTYTRSDYYEKFVNTKTLSRFGSYYKEKIILSNSERI